MAVRDVCVHNSKDGKLNLSLQQTALSRRFARLDLPATVRISEMDLLGPSDGLTERSTDAAGPRASGGGFSAQNHAPTVAHGRRRRAADALVSPQGHKIYQGESTDDFLRAERDRE